MVISVIVPTANRIGLLLPTLKSFIGQEFPADRFEVLIIDNASTDATGEAIEQFMAHHPTHRIRYICEPEPGLLSGRHRGALEAQGEVLVFADDDIEAGTDWLHAVQGAFSDPSTQLVGGRNLPKYESAPPPWLEWFWYDHPYGRFCYLLSLLDFGAEAREIDADFIWGLNFAIRRQALFDLGGFHPDALPGNLLYFRGDGETGLTRKAKALGYKAVYQPQALVYHRVPPARMTCAYLDKRFFCQGVSDSYTDLRMGHRRDKVGEGRQVLAERLKSLLRPLAWHLRKALGVGSERLILTYRFQRAYLKGYAFHQAVIRCAPRLMEWVLKEDYWDYRLPRTPLRLPRRRV